MRTHVIAALLAASVALPAQAQTNSGAATPYRPSTTGELNAGSSTPSRPAVTSEVNQGAPSRVGASSGDATACCAPGSVPQVQPVVPTAGTGAPGVSNPFTLFMCLPTYGDKTLFSGGGSGANPNTCVWKGPVKTRQCDCSTYQYRNVHTQTGPGGGSSDYEEAYNNSSCVNYTYVTGTYCIFNSCYNYSTPTCGGSWS